MITGFLFFSKLIDGRSRGIDWGKLFISRFMRLVPLYFFTMILLFSLVAAFTDATLHEPVSEVLKEVCQWLLFTIFDAPKINTLENTYLILAGVTWSLPYEWFFYFSLPLLAIAVGIIPPSAYIALGIVGVIGLATRSGETYLLFSFLGGIISALLFRLDSFRQFAVRKLSSFILLGCMTAIVIFYPKVDSILPFFLLSFTFALIACGNTIFGILTSPVSRMLGDMSYSIYLLHGIALMFIFKFVIVVDKSHALSLTEYWLRIVVISPCIVIISFITYRLIELPAIKKTPIFTLWLRESLSRILSGIR
jgi:peptidoglycan/LPS O-acetylase OafA/YrhL